MADALPREFPPGPRVYDYFRTWRPDGTWERIHDTLLARVRRKAARRKHPTAGALDSQSVKASASPGERGYDAGNKVHGGKRHIVVDTLGLLLDVVVTAASVQDRDGARVLLGRLHTVLGTPDAGVVAQHFLAAPSQRQPETPRHQHQAARKALLTQR